MALIKTRRYFEMLALGLSAMSLNGVAQRGLASALAVADIEAEVAAQDVIERSGCYVWHGASISARSRIANEPTRILLSLSENALERTVFQSR